MLCVPLGRDQFFNASQVEALGLGRVIPAHADPVRTAAAVRALLGDGGTRAKAAEFANIVASYGGGVNADRELSMLLG